MPDSRFKPYQQNQLRLLPLDLSEMVPENHMARVIDRVVESLDTRALEALYPGGGAPAYDPRMMLKVVLFAYASGIYSSRKISEATRSNVCLLWLTGCTPLDHMTVNRFRTERLRGVFEGVFADVVMLLAELGHVTLDTYFLDGTKVEANANKYSFTWRKSSEKHRDKLRARIGELLDEVDAIDEEEERIASGLPEPEELTSKDLDEIARRLNARLERRPGDKKAKKALRQVEGDFSERMRRYERDLADMGGRKSLSKTDRDATFMRMKEDHMKNGQLKAGYNVQVGTENQFVVHATVHQRPGDAACMKPHLESLKRSLGRIPSRVVADAGYGGEENYAYLQEEGSRAFVKHQMFHKEQKRSFKDDPSQPPELGIRRRIRRMGVRGRAQAGLPAREAPEELAGIRVEGQGVRLPRLRRMRACGRLPEERGGKPVHPRKPPVRAAQEAGRREAHKRRGGRAAQAQGDRRRDGVRRREAQLGLHAVHAARDREGGARVAAAHDGAQPEKAREGACRKRGGGSRDAGEGVSPSGSSLSADPAGEKRRSGIRIGPRFSKGAFVTAPSNMQGICACTQSWRFAAALAG